MSIELVKIPVSVVGSDGSATGTAYSRPLNGFYLGHAVDYATAVATTDTVISLESTNGEAAQAIVTLTDNVTDVPFRPVQALIYDTSNTVTTFYTEIPLHGCRVQVTVSQSNALADAVVVYVWYRKE